MKLLFGVSLAKEDRLLRRFEEIHDYIYANDGLSPQQALEEFVKILFIKIYDENNSLNQFVISTEEQRQLESGELPQNFIKRITELFDQTQNEYQDIFDLNDRIKISQLSLGFTVQKLQEISLLDSSQDAKGLAFQKFLSHQEKDRLGQFFTPEPVIDFCVDVIQPDINETIIDPACGSGGFLTAILKYLQNKHENINIANIIANNIFGLDINKSILRIAKMKLLLESNVKTNLYCLNSLDDITAIQSLTPFNNFDCVLTNPPFGAKINNTAIISKYDLGCKWSKKDKDNIFYKTKSVYSNQNADILFIERCLQLLREGGRMGIVLPNGNFENPSLEYLRYYIKLKAKILAIVNLPQETFIPYGTGVKTSLLFLEKNTANTKKQYSVFFGKVTKLGYQGNKNGTPVYQKDQYGQTLKKTNGLPVFDENFSAIAEQYKKFREQSKLDDINSFSIDYSELNGRFDFDFYSPENRKMFSILHDGQTVKLGEICDIIKTKTPKLKENDLWVEYVELSDVSAHSYEIINSTTYQVHELPSRASYEIKEGDIITAIAGNSVGTPKHATAIVTQEFDGCICTNGFRILRNFKLDFYYLLYFFRTELFLKQMFMYRTGAAIPNISDIDLANTRIYLPNKNVIKDISTKMKNAFDLRRESRKQMEKIKNDFALV
ncbi:MAG: N-6 DNA methylase [Planctomycetaceae bacterium]|jgi:type I restriction enzyme M protein|nr:N-6 DNA methylase [Planctomycetaceae bacterium]